MKSVAGEVQILPSPDFREMRPQNEIRGRMDALRWQISVSVFTTKDFMKVKNGRNHYRYATTILEYSGPN